MSALPVSFVLIASFFGQGSGLQAPEEAPSWAHDVRPILSENCFACHGPDPDAREAGLRLDTRGGMLAKGLLDLDEPSESELLYRVTTEDEYDRMPPPETGHRLTDAEVDVLRRWVESGAEWAPHWAYAPFQPSGAEGIDALVRARFELGPRAEARDLIRRLYLDVTGLPPGRDVLAAFEADPSDRAYAAIVDRLLGSDAYGEHWARHWLDLARYADSHGYTIDGGRSIWPWRDWVIRAIASDLPFDEFTVHQLAGDLLPDASRDSIIATGFHRNTQVNQEGGAKDEENRISAVIDRVNTTGAVWLGSSVACAQCHTHKFDPITHTEYYGLFAFLNSTTDGGVSAEPSLLVSRNAEEEALASAWEAKLAAAEKRYAGAWAAASEGWTIWQPERATGSNGPELRPGISGAYRVLGQSPVYSTYVLQGTVTSDLPQMDTLRLEVLPDGGPGRSGGNFVLQEVRVATRELGTDTWVQHGLRSSRADFEQDTRATGGGHYPAASVATGEGPGWAIKPEFQTPHVLELATLETVVLEGRELRLELVQEWGSNHTLGAFRIGLAQGQAATTLVPGTWREAWTALHRVRSERPQLPRTLVLEERAAPRVTRRFGRGSFLDPLEVVEAHVPRALNHFAQGEAAPRTRLEFARWLVHPEHALVHRVTVNRWWQQLFGTGLVPTENDFGLRGARPSNPELLEWLAQDYVAHGFSRVHTLRRILLSETYRQSSAADPRRLSGEVLRDSMLAVSGLLDRTVGGEPVQPPQPPGVFAFTQSRKNWSPSEGTARFRRSIYTRIWRSSPFPFYSTFDAPSPGFACTRRTTSSSPLQALALANDPLVIEIAAGMGRRLLDESPDASLEERARVAIRLALGREASEEEVTLLGKHAEAVRQARGELAACTAIARVVFNLHEFTHRP